MAQSIKCCSGFTIFNPCTKAVLNPVVFETGKKITQMNKGLIFFNMATTLESSLKKVKCSSQTFSI